MKVNSACLYCILNFIKRESQNIINVRIGVHFYDLNKKKLVNSSMFLTLPLKLNWCCLLTTLHGFRSINWEKANTVMLALEFRRYSEHILIGKQKLHTSHTRFHRFQEDPSCFNSCFPSKSTGFLTKIRKLKLSFNNGPYLFHHFCSGPFRISCQLSSTPSMFFLVAS